MAIKLVSLSNAVATTNDDGSVTITGKREEKGIMAGAGQVLLMPTKISNDDAFVSESTAAVSSIAWGVFGFHFCDFLQADTKADTISPLTSILKAA